jgi:tetratricopeptide (TPR) repeat protein
MSEKNEDRNDKPKQRDRPVLWYRIEQAWGPVASFIVLLVMSCLFVVFLARSPQRSALFVDLGVASFMVGCLLGFLFSSYGEETPTVGKVRDWIIGGLAGLTIAKLDSLKALLVSFASGPGPQAYALSLGESVAFATLGFFAMFFGRELILNGPLAQRRAQRGLVEGTRQAGLVTQKLLSALPPSILSGIDDIDDLMESHKAEAERLRDILYSEDVTKFLSQSEDAVRIGASLDWDVVSKAATLNYYLTYYEEGDDKQAQEQKASEWIVRALVMNPLHPDFSAKYADVLGMLERYDEAVAILEKLDRNPEAAGYVKQWLGYFLLYLPDREDDAIRVSEEYHSRFPSESDSIFNVACGYAQKYCAELNITKQNSILDSKNRTLALERLREALKADPDFAETVRTDWVKKGESFECLREDKEFLILVGLTQNS